MGSQLTLMGCAFALASCALCLWFLLAVGGGCVWTLGVGAGTSYYG